MKDFKFVIAMFLGMLLNRIADKLLVAFHVPLYNLQGVPYFGQLYGGCTSQTIVVNILNVILIPTSYRLL